MNRRNEGIAESDILQNQFTAYVQTALQHCKSQYLAKQSTIASHEVSSMDDGEASEDDFVLVIAENDALRVALGYINERERLVVTLRAVEEKSFQEIAVTLGMKYSSVTMIYYRALDKLRIILREDEERL